jgi:hypothetical protein
LYFRRELVLAHSLFDRFLAAIVPLPMGPRLMERLAKTPPQKRGNRSDE